MGPVLSIVAPAYNEERNIPAFLAAIVPVLEGIGETFEIIFVNDGSRDGTLGMLAAAAAQDPRIKVVGLARNFGKDIALSAGLAHASGQAVIPIDCDLQHPVELIPAFVAKWREGYDMVIGVRSRRDEEGYVRRTLSRTYYRVMKFMTSVEIPPNAGDFRLLDRKILDIINKMPERHRFMKGIFAWPGFRVASIEFQANVRANETRSTWSFFKLWRFALDGLFSFSTAPLKLWTYIGALSAGGAFLYLLITIIQKLFWGIAVPGYASLLIVVLFFNGLLLISNGIQGEYIARIFEEVKGRPLYVIGETFGFPDSAPARAGSGVVAKPLAALSTTPHIAPPPPDTNATQIGIPSAPVSANAPLAVAASPASGAFSTAAPLPETRPLRPQKITQQPAAGALGPTAFANLASPGSPSSGAPSSGSPSPGSSPAAVAPATSSIGSATPSSARRPHSPSQAGTPAPASAPRAHSPSQSGSPASSTSPRPHSPSQPPASSASPRPHSPSQSGSSAVPPSGGHAPPFAPQASVPPSGGHAPPFAPSHPSGAHASSAPSSSATPPPTPPQRPSSASVAPSTPHSPPNRAPSSPPVAAPHTPTTRAPSSPPVATASHTSSRAPSSPPVATAPPSASDASATPDAAHDAVTAPTAEPAVAAPAEPATVRQRRELPKPTKGPSFKRD